MAVIILKDVYFAVALSLFVFAGAQYGVPEGILQQQVVEISTLAGRLMAVGFISAAPVQARLGKKFCAIRGFTRWPTAFLVCFLRRSFFENVKKTPRA